MNSRSVSTAPCQARAAAVASHCFHSHVVPVSVLPWCETWSGVQIVHLSASMAGMALLIFTHLPPLRKLLVEEKRAWALPSAEGSYGQFGSSNFKSARGSAATNLSHGALSA